MTLSEKYEAVIGLEVHAQLATASKLFCGDSTAFGAQPNTQVSPITLGHPGTLPKTNRKAVEYAIQMGLACHCEIERYNYFARKNYFYPDLPKGYQVSQHTTPICKGGTVTIKTDNGHRDVQLNRIHLEEDAGKSIHDIEDHYTCVDYNRAGTPLIEIVTEPDLHSAEEAYQYVTEVRRMVRWLGICDGNMEEGSLRCDANVSVRLRGETKLGTKVEVKNLNSIRNVKKAIEHEIERLYVAAGKRRAHGAADTQFRCIERYYVCHPRQGRSQRLPVFSRTRFIAFPFDPKILFKPYKANSRLCHRHCRKNTSNWVEANMMRLNYAPKRN